MALYEASIDKDWKDFTDIHATIRKNLEEPIEKFISGEKQNLLALWGPYGQGKTQLMYHLFKYSWEKGGIALFTKLEKLLPEDDMGSDDFKNHIETLIKQTIIKIKNDKIDGIDLLNNECKSWLKQWLKNNPIRENLEERAMLLIDEMEQNYSSLLDKVTTDDYSPLKDCTAQDSFMIIAAFAPTSQYEAMTGEAEKRRWESYRLPTLPAKVLRERDAKYGNFTWWVSKGRLGLAFKILDILRNRPLNDFNDFEEFADKDIGRIAKVPSIDTSELANYMKIKDYIIELFPHSKIKHRDGLVSGKIIEEEEFINILKDGLTEERWKAREIELFSDYLKYVISALSNENGFLLPQKNEDGNDPKRILTLLKIAVDFAIETEGRKEVIATIYDKIYKWGNFVQFYYTNIFPRVSDLSSSDAYAISYDLLPKLFPLPITSPIIGENPIEKSKENLLTSHPSTDYITEDIETLHGGQITFFYFINNQKLKQFLDSAKVKDFLPPDRGLICIVLENKEDIRLEGVTGWLSAQNQMKIEYPSKMLRDFLISFMDYYQLSSQNKGFRDILKEKVEEEFKKDKTLSRKLDYYKNILNEFIRFNSNLILSGAKFEVKNKDTINNYRTRYDKFSDVVGLSFCKINELSTFNGFKQIVMGSDDLKELRTGVPGLLKDVSVSKVGKKPLKLSTTLETIEQSFNSELGKLTALANLVDEENFINLSSEENSKEVLRGIFKYIKIPQYDKSSIIQEINDVIESIDRLKKSREKLNKAFSDFKIKESKSERTKEKWSGILGVLGKLNGGYLEYLICNFAKAILEKFKDDILSNDQNWLTEWQKNKQYVENYNESLIKIDNLEYAPKWLNIDKNKMKEKPQEGYSDAIKSLTTFQDKVDFNAVNGLPWDSFNEELAQINNALGQVMEIEEKLKEIVTTADGLNKILGGEEL